MEESCITHTVWMHALVAVHQFRRGEYSVMGFCGLPQMSKELGYAGMCDCGKEKEGVNNGKDRKMGNYIL